MLTIREKPNLFLRKTTHSVAGADHDEKKNQGTKDDKFLRKQTWNAGQSHPMDVLLCWSCQKTLYRQTVNTLSGEKIEKKKEKRERKRCLKVPGVRGGFWQSSAEKWEGQRNYSLKDSLHKDANSCFSIRKDQRIEVRAKSFALHSPFARNFFVTWVSCEHGLWAGPVQRATVLYYSAYQQVCSSVFLSIALIACFAT